ncbi:hypothetical protein HON86_03355 [Candidatus Woesearchaeota archaeon]|jgi:hypothetical protein|nr:hypothetical protein [Candidatus Woesearchaeota archaeon]MBT4835626.1 hypothetical protein [Candidatus Woesearchaeota archaeon]MBT6735137.1 hypothetical protein [Candidatus Woesearchaeota archaeon]MBT7169819.1 hypothetical protein [Candidatus Woesearchaeota archaeon]MBT7474946.1 hypothetical protein [Candidatus Woesearchaeota archaeon]
MINLSELVRKEDKTSFFNSLKFAHSSDVYLAEEIGDFLANKGRIYVPSFKQFPMPILDSYFSFYYVKMHDVFLEYLDEEYWNVHDEDNKFIGLWPEEEKRIIRPSEYTYAMANVEQGFESGDQVHSLTFKYFQKIPLVLIVDVQKNMNFEYSENSVLDKIKDKFEEIILREPELN